MDSCKPKKSYNRWFNHGAKAYNTASISSVSHQQRCRLAAGHNFLINSLRKEKEFLIANRKRLEKEFAIQREKQLSEALDREAEIARIIRQQQNEIFKIKRKEHQVRSFLQNIFHIYNAEFSGLTGKTKECKKVETYKFLLVNSRCIGRNDLWISFTQGKSNRKCHRKYKIFS